MNGKGDRQRPTDMEAYGRGYERIFGHAGPRRVRFVPWPPLTAAEITLRDEWLRRRERRAEGERDWHRDDHRAPAWCRRCGGRMASIAPIGDWYESVCVDCREHWALTGAQLRKETT